MARLLRMPEVAANAAEAVLQEWTVSADTPFSAEDPIATVETEKAAVDVEADAPGIILKTLVPAGTQVEVGAPIAVIGDPGEQVEDMAALLSELGVSADRAPVSPEREVGDDMEREVAPDSTRAATNGQPATTRIFASPLARRLARESGLSVEDITGTGPGGRIVRRDVEAARSARTNASASEPQARRKTQVARVQGSPTAPYTDLPHSRTRQAIASRLTESKQSVPHFYVRATVDVGKLLRLRHELNEGGGDKVSVNDLVLKAAARAHVLVPEMNVIWTSDAVRSFTSVDISVAVATDQGLVTPVLRAVEQMPISAVASNSRDLVERSRAGRLRQDELEGGSLSLSNLGMFGTEEFAGIINPPQAALLAVGAARTEPVVKKGKLSTGTVMRVTLSVDHRPVDGTVAARWMQAFTTVVEKPVQILA